MNIIKKYTVTLSIFLIIVVLSSVLMYIQFKQSKQPQNLPIITTGDNSPILLYRDLYPVVTASNPFGGWEVYENVKYHYMFAHPKQVLVGDGGALGDQSTTTEHNISTSSDPKRWNVIKIERRNKDTLLVYLTVEAWGPNTIYGNEYIPVGLTDLKTFVERLNDTWAAYENIPPPKIEKTLLGTEVAYKIKQNGRSLIFSEHNKTKFIIAVNNDPISEMVVSSFKFTK